MRLQIKPEVRTFLVAQRVARLATADAKGAPHVVPICYAFDGHVLYSPMDRKPKSVEPRGLKRVRNIAENPRIAFVVDEYSEDWSALAYVLIHGTAEILERGEERDRAESLLRDKYPQYDSFLDPGCMVLKITPEKVVSWGRL